MNSLSTIVRQNREAVRQGIIKAGSAVGTTGFVPHNERKPETAGFFDTKGHRDDNGGLRGHSIGENYPFSVVGGFRTEGETLVTTWTVVNSANGQTFETYDGLPLDPQGCENAHNRAAVLKRQSLRNPEY